MFFSADILTLRSGQHNGLGVVWLAATLGPRSQTRRLARRDWSSVDLVEACDFLMHPPEPLSLRLSSNLMMGVTRVYGQQFTFFCSTTWV
mgnify:CR=1 FL=1